MTCTSLHLAEPERILEERTRIPQTIKPVKTVWEEVDRPPAAVPSLVRRRKGREARARSPRVRGSCAPRWDSRATGSFLRRSGVAAAASFHQPTAAHADLDAPRTRKQALPRTAGR